MPLPNMPNDASVAEILSEASKLKAKKDKVDFLSQYKNRRDMEHIIKGAYHPAIVWLVPDGPLPEGVEFNDCLLYTSPSPRDATLSRMPSSA